MRFISDTICKMLNYTKKSALKYKSCYRALIINIISKTLLTLASAIMPQSQIEKLYNDKGNSMRGLLLSLFKHLNRKRRSQLLVLFVLMLLSAASEVVTLASVMPFLSLLSRSETAGINTYKLLPHSVFTSENTENLIISSVLLFVLILCLTSAIRIFNIWANLRFASIIGTELSVRVYASRLYQPYSFHISDNTSNVVTTITSQTRNCVIALQAFLQFCTSLTVSIGLFIGLLWVDWRIALVSILLFGFLYGFVALKSKAELRRNSFKVAKLSKKILQNLQEGLGSIRDILLDHSQAYYINEYELIDEPQRKLQARNKFLASYPRFLFESIGIISLLGLSICLTLVEGKSFTAFLPVLGAFALGSQRLLPTLQQCYSTYSQFRSFSADISDILVLIDMNQVEKKKSNYSIKFENKISFEDVSFSYDPEKQSYQLLDVSLEIYRGETIGIMGETGSGKSTFSDLFMGLIMPTSGLVVVDQSTISGINNLEKTKAWRQLISHVPQTIYLSDTSIERNIAYGISKSDIDRKKVQKCAQLAELDAFILTLPNRYETLVGERGVKLSGGQRQRIGLARAFYKLKDILVMDEATSALDQDTEERIIKNIEAEFENITVFMIAHRLTTLKNCDKVIKFRNGRLAEIGTPEQILE